ncbi:MAG: alkaline phosphatase family protein [Alphaproteobacteria bacterium]
MGERGRTAGRVIVLGLDGYEASFGERLMAEGRMPHLARLKAQSARFGLDHGPERYTGLAWEHVATGLNPERSGRWTAVDFDPATYRTRQPATAFQPVFSGLGLKPVIFDAPYCDLARTPDLRGLVSWGAHDPGVEPTARPASLMQEIEARFGPYPAPDFIYAFTWPDPALTARAADALVEALERRTAITKWLLRERFRDWDLGMVVVGELHSAIEPFWHGVDPDHPLADHPSARAAGEGLTRVYEALDRLIGMLMEEWPDIPLMAFSMHGMGPNEADVPSMILLPELLYRDAFGAPHFEAPAAWRDAPKGCPTLAPGEHWDLAVKFHLGASMRPRPSPLGRLKQRVARFLPGAERSTATGLATESLGWMPSQHYQPFWSRMDAFAVPSFYDGRIRLNLTGREVGGRIDPEDYDEACARIEDLLRACRDPRTGAPVVRSISRAVEHAAFNGEPGRPGDPFALPGTQADLIVIWQGSPQAFEHPRHGMIGPCPMRRTGGHTGGDGVLYVHAAEWPAGEHGRRRALDAVPTLLELAGATPPSTLSGTSIRPGARTGPAETVEQDHARDLRGDLHLRAP